MPQIVRVLRSGKEVRINVDHVARIVFNDHQGNIAVFFAGAPLEAITFEQDAAGELIEAFGGPERDGRASSEAISPPKSLQEMRRAAIERGS